MQSIQIYFIFLLNLRTAFCGTYNVFQVVSSYMGGDAAIYASSNPKTFSLPSPATSITNMSIIQATMNGDAIGFDMEASFYQYQSILATSTSIYFVFGAIDGNYAKMILVNFQVSQFGIISAAAIGVKKILFFLCICSRSDFLV